MEDPSVRSRPPLFGEQDLTFVLPRHVAQHPNAFVSVGEQSLRSNLSSHAISQLSTPY